MSAFIVNAKHIDVIVSYFVGDSTDSGLWTELDGNYDYMNNQTAKRVAKILMYENVRSVQERYQEYAHLKEHKPYEYNYVIGAKEDYSIAEISRLLDCLEYQSCETADYHQSKAYMILCNMRKDLLSRLQDQEGVELWDLSYEEYATNEV